MAEEVLVRKLVSPEYTAVIELLPVARRVVVNVATPSETVPVPRLGRAVSSNVDGIGGRPAPGLTGLTVAVKVTLWPATDGFGLVVSVVVVDACATVTDDRRRGVLLEKFVSP